MSEPRSSPFPRGLMDPSDLRRLRRRADDEGLRHLAGHAALLAATGVLVLATRGSAWVIPFLVAHGVVLTFAFAPLHESIHYTAFRNRRLNEAVAAVCGFLLLLPPRYFRAFHFGHHLFTQDPERDPELTVAKPESGVAYLVYLSGLPYWRERIATLARHASGREMRLGFISWRQQPAIEREALRYALAYGAIGLGTALAGWFDTLLLLWLVPALLGQPALRIYLLAEHTGCPTAPDMLANSRTVLTNKFMRWLAWNMPYHAEHHAYPWLPFHALPAVHEVLRGHLGVIAPGYIAASRDILRAARGGSL